MSYGCGRFSDESWAELLAAGDRNARADVAQHVHACERCRAEYRALTQFGRDVRAGLTGDSATKETFVDAVIAEARMLKPARPKRNPLPSGPVAWAAAGVFTLYIALFTGVFQAPGPQSASTGFTVPGGTIMMSMSSDEPVSASALTTVGMAAAAAEPPATLLRAVADVSVPESEPPRTARPISSSRGVVAAAALVNGS